MFATDRDLLVYEPRLFLDVAWLGQRLARVNASVASGLAVSAGTDFSALGVQAGGVASYADASHEVILIVGPDRLALSRLRATTDDAVIAPPPASSTVLEVVTFRPQMAVVHHHVLRMLGIEPDDPREGSLGEAAVLNPASVTRLECLGTLHLIYSAAAASATGVSVGGSGYVQRALMYRERFAAERARVSVLIDTDGDGRPDATRRPGVGHLVRG